MLKNNETRIKVSCRLRPINKVEMGERGQNCVNYSDTTVSIYIAEEQISQEFTFDNIFGPEDSQAFIFQQTTQSVIEGVLQGYNGTIFAYGQTGSGKTHTMEGPEGGREDPQQMGVLPRMMGALFQGVKEAQATIQFQVKVSFLEIYMEKLHDLLEPTKSNLMIKEDKQRGIYVKDSTEIYVDSDEQMMDVMRIGGRNRSIACTRMNDRSSRSHSIFIATIFQKDTSNDTVKLSKLYSVDLAGSEKVGKTNVTGQQLEEAKMINKSLAALGNVINALSDKNSTYVPYRDSKLTRILQESLGGNAKTTLIICCSMNSYNARETLSTLRFGARAKNVKNKPVINQERSAKELEALLEKTDYKIKNLAKILQNACKFIEQRFNQQIVRDFQEVISNGIILENEQTQLNQQKDNLDTPTLKQPQKEKESVTLLLLRQHTKICQLEEDICNLRQEKEEILNEMSCRNQEITEMTERQEIKSTSQAIEVTDFTQQTIITEGEGIILTDRTETFQQEGMSTCESITAEEDKRIQQPFLKNFQQEFGNNLEDIDFSLARQDDPGKQKSYLFNQEQSQQYQNLNELQGLSECRITDFNKFRKDSIQLTQNLENQNGKLQETVETLQKQLDQKAQSIENERKGFLNEIEMKDRQI